MTRPAGKRWHDEPSSPHPLSVSTHAARAGTCRPVSDPAAAGFPGRANLAPACRAGNRAITCPPPPPGHRMAAGRPLRASCTCADSARAGIGRRYPPRADLLAAGRARARAASQRRSRPRPARRCGVAVRRSRGAVPDDGPADHAARPPAAGLTGAGEREASQGAELGCGLTRTSRPGTGGRGVARPACPQRDD
jgi:hypothetical protein